MAKLHDPVGDKYTQTIEAAVTARPSMMGTFSVVQASVAHEVELHLALLRLPTHDTDLLVTLNDPVGLRCAHHLRLRHHPSTSGCCRRVISHSLLVVQENRWSWPHGRGSRQRRDRTDV